MSKVVLVTGSSTGIGAISAVELAPDNDLIIHYHSSLEQALQIAKTIEEKGGRAHLLQADLTSETGCLKVAQFIESTFGKLDILINNAGCLDTRHGASEITWPLMEKIFALNTFSVMRLTALCIPLLKKGNEPNIVNVTSVSMRTGAPTATVYAAAKAAIDSFTRGIAQELAPQIRVNAVAPGYINTPFHHNLTSFKELEQIAEGSPLKALGEPKHIAKTIKFLVENDFITGETVDVNGGLFMR